MLIAGFCAAIYQFYRRREWRVAVGCVVLVIGATTAIATEWPGIRLFAPLGEVTEAWADPALTRLRILDGRMQVSAYNPRALHSVAAPIVLDGLPSGYTATPFTLQGRLTRAAARSSPADAPGPCRCRPRATITRR